MADPKLKSNAEELSNVPEVLWEQAINDFENVLKSDDYVIDMSVWWVPHAGKCNVCLAGSLLANRYEMKDGKLFSDVISDISNNFSAKLRSVDSFRTGRIVSAVEHMRMINPEDCRLAYLSAYAVQEDPDNEKLLFEDLYKNCRARDWHTLIKNLRTLIGIYKQQKNLIYEINQKPLNLR